MEGVEVSKLGDDESSLRIPVSVGDLGQSASHEVPTAVPLDGLDSDRAVLLGEDVVDDLASETT